MYNCHKDRTKDFRFVSQLKLMHLACFGRFLFWQTSTTTCVLLCTKINTQENKTEDDLYGDKIVRVQCIQ